MKQSKQEFLAEAEKKIHKNIKFIYSNSEGNIHNFSADGEMAMLAQVNKYKDSLESDDEKMALFEKYEVNFDEFFERVKNETLNVVDPS